MAHRISIGPCWEAKDSWKGWARQGGLYGTGGVHGAEILRNSRNPGRWDGAEAGGRAPPPLLKVSPFLMAQAVSVYLAESDASV